MNEMKDLTAKQAERLKVMKNASLVLLFALVQFDSKGLGNLSDAKTDEWPGTIQKVIAKFPSVKTVIPGHGRIGGKELLEHTKELLRKYTDD
jgi:hypothetical protein